MPLNTISERNMRRLRRYYNAAERYASARAQHLNGPDTYPDYIRALCAGYRAYRRLHRLPDMLPDLPFDGIA